ncbi:MAG: B12-binding domain-containing radical SAM protein [Candidatus Woesearchaeota archaeon]
MKILFVRPPRYMWPMNSESSSFWQPLGFASMAAVLRENGFKDVEILDCLPLKIGWKSLANKLRIKNPDIICVGDETASYYESVKVIKLTRKIFPNVIIIAGGYYFGNMPEESLKKTSIDFIVRGEGEITLLELIKNISNQNKNYSKIKGICFRTKNGIKINLPREPINNLDDLPFPAYDLLPMHLYGKKSKNHKNFVAMEHGRGCVGSCTFCSIWQQMPKHTKDGKLIPCYRTKSAKRCFEETKYFVEKYNRKTINWVDGTFNADPNWTKEYFGLLEKYNIKVNHTTWMRADFIVRDEKLGLMKKMADNGLVQIIVGMERFDDDSMKKLGKYNNSLEINKQAFKILKKYPKIYSIATLIYGMPDDKWKDLFMINKMIHSNFADMIFMLPFTPYPGTADWEKYKDKVKDVDLRKFNLHLPVMSTKYIPRWQLNIWFKFSLLDYLIFRPKNVIKRIAKERNIRKKNVQKSLAGKIWKLATRHAWNKIRFQKIDELEYGIKPKWYDK